MKPGACYWCGAPDGGLHLNTCATPADGARHHDPCDMGAILRTALALSGLTAADVARATGIAPPHVSRALRSPDTRPPVARRILAALGMRLEAVPTKRRKRQAQHP